MSAAYFADVDASASARRSPPRRRAEPRVGPVRPARPRPRGRAGRPGIRRLRRGGGWALLARPSALTFFVPPVSCCAACRRRRATARGARRAHRHGRSSAPRRCSSSDLRAAVAALGPRVWNGYGQGESPVHHHGARAPCRRAMAVARGRRGARCAGSARARRHPRARRRRPTTLDLPPGEVGGGRRRRPDGDGRLPRAARRRPPRPCAAAGCTPATSGASTPRATSRSSTAPRTSSSPAATTSTRARSRTC